MATITQRRLDAARTECFKLRQTNADLLTALKDMVEPFEDNENWQVKQAKAAIAAAEKGQS